MHAKRSIYHRQTANDTLRTRVDISLLLLLLFRIHYYDIVLIFSATSLISFDNASFLAIPSISGRKTLGRTSNLCFVNFFN